MDKQKIAALTGVLSYLQAEQHSTVHVDPVPPTLPTPWTSYGRQQTMANRELIQRRVMKR